MRASRLVVNFDTSHAADLDKDGEKRSGMRVICLLRSSRSRIGQATLYTQRQRTQLTDLATVEVFWHFGILAFWHFGIMPLCHCTIMVLWYCILFYFGPDRPVTDVHRACPFPRSLLLLVSSIARSVNLSHGPSDWGACLWDARAITVHYHAVSWGLEISVK
ncbi:hypothetical protein GGR55DRAFT_231474 [Xylaria sp. FL0064]|nr:hypothetical protein GGR55DRAFT_231474 [Xylaria sp. FL0064]